MLIYISDGRLGNQLFQYAFLNSVAKDNEKIVAINMRQFCEGFSVKNDKFRPLFLGAYTLFFLKKLIKPFVLNFFARIKIIGYIKQDRSSTSALPTYKKFKGLLPITLVESNFFQSEDFFDQKCVDFTIRRNFIEQAKEFLNPIPQNMTKVFVHVRRGDYLFESYQGQRGTNLPKSYFDKAISLIKEDVSAPFFVFLSDDPEFVEYCFSDISNKLVSKNDMMTDLAIMTLCDYGVVSNSSFSWWGGYLMEDRKKVIFPKYWYGWKSKVESHVGIQPSWSYILDIE